MTTIKIDGIDYASQPAGTAPKQGDQILLGTLYRPATPAPTAQPASATPATTTPATTHWYDSITPGTVAKWIGVGVLLALAIWAVVALTHIEVTQSATQPAATQPAAAQPAAAQPAAAQPAAGQSSEWKDHMLWSIGGDPSFVVTDGIVSESGNDLFTDASKGALSLDIAPDPSDPVCLLQFGLTSIHTSAFTASFPVNSDTAGFRIISKSAWDKLTPADGAYDLCWKR